MWAFRRSHSCLQWNLPQTPGSLTLECLSSHLLWPWVCIFQGDLTYFLKRGADHFSVLFIHSVFWNPFLFSQEEPSFFLSVCVHFTMKLTSHFTPNLSVTTFASCKLSPSLRPSGWKPHHSFLFTFAVTAQNFVTRLLSDFSDAPWKAVPVQMAGILCVASLFLSLGKF